MAGSIKEWVDNQAPTCAAVDLNSINQEINNAITESGQTLNYTVTDQLGKAIKSVEIQDYTEVGTVGTADQQKAGHIFELNEEGTDKALYLFKSGADLLLDESANNYDLTQGDAGNLVVVCDGSAGKVNIMGEAKGAYFPGAGTSGLKHATALAGIDNDVSFDFWILPHDGQSGGSQELFTWYNNANNQLFARITATGEIQVHCRVNGGAYVILTSVTVLPNGTPSEPIRIGVYKHLTYGIGLWVNDVLEAQSLDAAILPDFTNTTGELYIGTTQVLGNNYKGVIDMFRIKYGNNTIFQEDSDLSCSVKIALPTALVGKDVSVDGFLVNTGIFSAVQKFNPEIIKINSTHIYLRRCDLSALSTRKLLGRI